MSTTEQAATPPDTGMRLHEGDDWPVVASYHDDEDGFRYRIDGAGKVIAMLRRVGWLDQKGRVWLKVPPGAGFDGGSLTPLLIDARDD